MPLFSRRSTWLALLLGAVLLLGFCAVAAQGSDGAAPEAVPTPDAATPDADADTEAAKPTLKEKLLAAYEKVVNFDAQAQLERMQAAVKVLQETDYHGMFETAKTTLLEGDIRNVETGLLVAYLALVIMAVLPIIIGSLQSTSASSSDEPAEIMTSADAAYFPIQASITLFGLYMLFQLFGKEYVNYLLSGYFFLLGIGAVTWSLCPLGAMIAPSSLNDRKFHLYFKESGPAVDAEEKEAKDAAAKDGKGDKASAGADAGVWLDSKFSATDICCFAVALAIGAAYLKTKHWILNNIFGMAFATNGISLLQLGSFGIGATLLVGLFFYDVFWVFGTDVMVTVAKSFDAPIKVIFPRDFLTNGIWATEHAMLGLGDIVLPGVLIALLLRFDRSRNGGSPVYFVTALFAYVLGLVLTVFVMHTFKAAQPALLYLVPLGVSTPLLLSIVRGEVGALFKYSDEDAAAAPAKEKKAQ